MGLEGKSSKNLEDSAIGSMSCQATHTTASENGGSPLKCDHVSAPHLASSPHKLQLAPTSRLEDDFSNATTEPSDQLVPELRLPREVNEFARSLEQLPYIDLGCPAVQTQPRNGGSEQILDSHSLQRASTDSRFLSPPTTFRFGCCFTFCKGDDKNGECRGA